VWCDNEECPLTCFVCGVDMCISCFKSAAATLHLDIYTNYDTLILEECGHTVCEAQQSQEECDEDECCSCKSNARFLEKQKLEKEELAKCSNY
jgi:hypothetical protein